MKRSLSIFLVLLFSFQLLHSQVSETSTSTKEPILYSQQELQDLHDHYISKSKRQRNAGFIVLGLGLAAIGGGVAIGLSNLFSTENDGSGALAILGLCTTIASIPIFVSSGENKRKARAFVGSENVGFIGNPNYNTKYLSVGISIDL